MSRIDRSLETGSRLMVSGRLGREERRETANRSGVSVWGDGNAVELDSDDGCTTL